MCVQIFQPMILIYRRGNLVYYYKEVHSYRTLSYPLTSLIIKDWTVGQILVKIFLAYKTNNKTLQTFKVKFLLLNLKLYKYMFSSYPVKICRCYYINMILYKLWLEASKVTLNFSFIKKMFTVGIILLQFSWEGYSTLRQK